MAPPSRAEDIQGWMSSAELLWLCKQASAMSSIAEIGSWRGRSTFALLSGCTGPVYAVDHWQGSRDELNNAHKDATDQDVFSQFFDHVGHFPNLKVVRFDSLSASRVIPDVDMVFIDACHLYEDVVADILAWLPKTRKLICGHDINQDDVMKAVQDQLGEINSSVGSIWYYEVVRGSMVVDRSKIMEETAVVPPNRPGRDARCGNCNQTTDDSLGQCRFCGAAFAPDEIETDQESRIVPRRGRPGRDSAE